MKVINFIKQSFWNTLAIISALFSEWLIMLVLPKSTSYSDAGIYSFCFSLSQILYIISTFSVREVQVVDAYCKHCEKSYFVLRIYTSFFALIVWGIYDLLMKYNATYFICIVFFVIQSFLCSMTDVMHGTLQIKDRLDLVGISGFLFGFIKLLFFLVMVKFKACFLTIVFFEQVICSLLYFIFTYIVYLLVIKKQPPFCFFYRGLLTDLKSIIKSVFPIFFITFIGMYASAFPKFVLEKTLEDKVYLGYYSILLSVSAIFPSVTSFLFAPLINSYSRMYRKMNFHGLAIFHLKVLFVTFCLCLVMTVCCIFVVPSFFSWYYGNELIQFINVFYISMVGASFLALTQLSRIIIIAFGKTMFFAYINIISVFIFTLQTFFLINKFFIFGAAFSLSLFYLINFVFITIFAFYILFKEQLKDTHFLIAK